MIALLAPLLAGSAQGTEAVSRVPLYIVVGYLGALIGLGLLAKVSFRGTSSDYFVAGRSIGPFLMLMSLFGTTMTAFAMVGSTGKAYDIGIGVYGLMASSSAVVHSLVFFVVGIKLWAIGKRHDYVTQIQFFRARFQSDLLGYLLFPILVGMVVCYLLIGIAGAGTVMRGLTVGMLPEVFPGQYSEALGKHLFVGAVPPWLTGLVISGVVLFYIFSGGMRGAVWANTMQTSVFMVMGLFAFWLVSNELGGMRAAAQKVVDNSPQYLAREGFVGHLQFLSYGLVPLSVGMFPHLFQHWLTAKSAKSFRLSLVFHPIFIMLVWIPCVLIGIWSQGIGIKAPGGNSNAVLAVVVNQLVHSPVISGLLTAGILAAIMSSLDSQFVCLGTMFTHDIVLHSSAKAEAVSDDKKVLVGRLFIVFIVAVVYGLSLLPQPHIFDLGVWCFSGFASLFPLVFAALYWRRVTRAGAIASVLVMAVAWFWFFYQGLIGPLARGEEVGEYLVLGLMPVTFIFLASGLTLWIVSLLTTPPPKEHVQRFFIDPA